MVSTYKDPVLVIIELTGANDYLNTIVPYNDPLYWDNRPKVHISQDELLLIDDNLAFRSDIEPLRDIYEKGIWRLFMESDLRIRLGHILGRWIFGIPANLIL